MALAGVAGAEAVGGLGDLVEAHRGVRRDGEVVPAVDELAGAQTPEAVADIAGDADGAGDLVFGPRPLPVEI
ncbi:MAG: hypothetical protein ACLPUT_02075 [Solirubrobacteraceae bacterium]